MKFAWDTLVRYLRLYRSFVAFSISKGFEFRFDFVMRIIMDLCYYSVAIAFFKIIYLHSPNLGGWNEKQMMVFVSGYLLIDAIIMTLFSNNLWWFPQMINRGDLDYYLVRPVSSLFFVSLREFALNSFVNFVFAFAIFVWAVMGLDTLPSIGSMILFLCLIFNGAFIFYAMNAMANMLVFWTHAPNGFGDVIWSMTRFTERPDRIFKGFIRKVLLFALPFSVTASFPARLLLDGFSWSIFLHTIGVSSVFLFLLVSLWKFGLRNYSSASS